MNVFALKDYVESLGMLWVPKIEQKETMFFLKDFFSERDMTKEEYEHVKNAKSPSHDFCEETFEKMPSWHAI